MLTRPDAWTLAVVLSGGEINGELKTLPEPYRRIAERLCELPVEARFNAWSAFLDGQADRDDLVRSIADARPNELRPVEDPRTDTDGWEPLRLRELPPVEPFPVDVLPLAAARLVVEGAEAVGCAPDFFGLFVLGAAGGTVGRSVSLRLKDGYFASASLFGAAIGPPSDGKTPALKAVMSAVRRIDKTLELEHAQALARWEGESQNEAKGAKKRNPGQPPRPQRIDVDDITMECLPLTLEDNPRGLIMPRDELSALVLGMNQFKGGKGYDRTVALKIWSGDTITKDRVNHVARMPVRCHHPCLTIVGGLTPDMMPELLDPKGRADGFVDRFLFCYPDPQPIADWTERGIPEPIVDDWCELIDRLWKRPLNGKKNRSVPHVAHFTPAAAARWQAEFNKHASEMNAADFPLHLRGTWGKLREYAGRLTLILALMDHAADPTRDECAVPNIEARYVSDAWRLINYFKSHAKRVRAAIVHGAAATDCAKEVMAVIEFLRDGQKGEFTEHELTQARRWIDCDSLAKALKFLEERNAIRPKPAPERNPKGGRPRSSTYHVNPALLNS
jgi:hypothetical protein